MSKTILDITGDGALHRREGRDYDLTLGTYPVEWLISELLPLDDDGWWHGRLHIRVELVEEGDA